MNEIDREVVEIDIFCWFGMSVTEIMLVVTCRKCAEAELESQMHTVAGCSLCKQVIWVPHAIVAGDGWSCGEAGLHPQTQSMTPACVSPLTA